MADYQNQQKIFLLKLWVQLNIKELAGMNFSLIQFLEIPLKMS
jgi:hypothetical protein